MSLKYTNKLLNKRVLVIGGTSGIGFCVAEACIEFGAIVTIASSRQERVDRAIERLTTSYPDAKARISGCSVDLASDDVEDELKRLFEFATKNGNLDHVVTTAGDALSVVPLNKITSEDMHRQGQIRYIAVVLMGKLAPHYMHQSSESSLTLTGGVSGRKPTPGWSTLVGWVAGKEGQARGLAVDLSPIRVNVVLPGVVQTAFFETVTDPQRLEQTLERYRSRTLLGKVGKPEDVAEAYLFCMRDTFVTGSTLVSDGGYTIHG